MKSPIHQPTEWSARRRKVGFVAAFLCGVVWVGAFVFHSREPVWVGKSAGAWIDELGDNSCLAASALRQMGSKAVGPLLRAIERKPVGWLDAYAVVVDHAPRILKPKLGAFRAYLLWRESRIPRVRAAAAQVLGDFGPMASNAAPALVRALRDTNATLRVNAAFALGKIGARPELAVPALAQSLADRDEAARMYAAIALKKFGHQAVRAVPELIATLKDRSWQVRERAALALGAVGKNQAGVVAALEHAMQDEHRFVRSSVATALACLSAHAETARAVLEQARYDPDAEVRYSAGRAVSQLESESRTSAGLK